MATTDMTIKFSNIQGDTGTTVPGDKDTTTVTGKSIDGTPMVNIEELVKIMGATVSYSGTTWTLTRSSQKTIFTQNSTTMTTSISYIYVNPATNANVTYSHEWTATLPKSAQIINNIKYVPLYIAAMQLGALLVENDAKGVLTVYDFRINGTTPLTDANSYIVGGDWLTSWSGKSDTKLSDNFKIKEFWNWTDKPGARQLKVAVALLASAERVRYFYNNNSSLTIEVGFRSWQWNKSITDSWSNSFHMRGRAFDIASKDNGKALYESVQNEFRAGNSTDLKAAGFYRTQDFTNGKSKGYEIETMPRKDVTWLHLQVKPGIDTANDQP